jgi:hypothetical protein
MKKIPGSEIVVNPTPSMKRIAAHIEALQVKYRLLEEKERCRLLAGQTMQQATSSDGKQTEE